MTALVLMMFVACGNDGRPSEGAGRVAAAITGGVAPSEAELLGTVVIANRAGATHCSGVLVERDVVLTAAHCIAGSGEISTIGLDVVAGARELALASETQRHPVRAAAVHSGFPGAPSDDPTSLGSDHDLALLFLEDPVTELEPVGIVDPTAIGSVLREGQPVLIAGFGTTEGTGLATGTLHVARTPVVRHSTGEVLVGGAGRPGTCRGDSGGPGYVDVGGEVQLLGITSRASHTEAVPCGGGSILTLVPRYAGFLAEHGVGAGASTAADGGISGGGEIGPGCNASSAPIHGGAVLAWLVAIGFARSVRRGAVTVGSSRRWS